MSLIVNFKKSRFPIYKYAVELSGATKLVIKDEAYNTYGSTMKNMMSLHDEGENEEVINKFKDILYQLDMHIGTDYDDIDIDELDHEYGEMLGNFNVLIGDIEETVHYAKLEIRPFTFKEQMENAKIREMTVNDLPRDKRIEILLVKLDMLIEDSLDKMNENNFKVYSNRRNRVLSMV